MEIFDFNIHLPFLDSDDVNVIVQNDLNLNQDGLLRGFRKHTSKMQNLIGANFLLFNTNLFSDPLEEFNSTISKAYQHSAYTALIDFRRPDLLDYLEKVKLMGAKAIMVNSYIQQIGEPDFAKVLMACQFAEANDMIVCIDGSYGTSKMYTYDNLKLACFISDSVTQTPVVIIHSGGMRILEAMLLALDKSNIWLDTSFSLPYYLGSSVEQDFAFAYKKIGVDRIVYGSDIPYLNSENSIRIHLDFFKKYRFGDSDIEKIMCENSLRLLFQ